VIIDNSTVVEASIICDDTYVGRDLEISGKIVSRNRLMDPETGETIILVDKFILSGETMPEILVAMKKFRSMLVAFLLLLAMSPFYFLFMLYFYISGSMVPRPVKFFDSSRKLCCVRAFRWRRGFLSELFFRLCLDKFPMLFEALKGRIFIAGNGIVGVKNTDRTFLDELLVYFPAVFSYWESLASSQGLSDSERRLHDLYYSHRRSLILDVKIVLRFFFRRLIGDYDRGEDIERNGQ
jgi:lipopolysaccharide/colanic/teichoic acid biosynthesis glycosyltransferase